MMCRMTSPTDTDHNHYDRGDSAALAQRIRAAWRRQCPDITDAEIDALRTLALGDGKARLVLAAFRLGLAHDRAAEPQPQPQHEVECPGCGAVIRARMADAEPAPRGCNWPGCPTPQHPDHYHVFGMSLPNPTTASDVEDAPALAAMIDSTLEPTSGARDLLAALADSISRARARACDRPGCPTPDHDNHHHCARCGSPEITGMNGHDHDVRTVAEARRAAGADDPDPMF